MDSRLAIIKRSRKFKAYSMGNRSFMVGLRVNASGEMGHDLNCVVQVMQVLSQNRNIHNRIELNFILLTN